MTANDFELSVRPILSDKCFECHGPDSAHREAELRLDVEEDAKEDRGGYRVIDVATPGESELLARIDSDDESVAMPPPDSLKQLTEEERKTLRRWIDSGAPWADAWAYQTPKRSPAPEVRDAEWCANWVDRFLLEQLEAAGIAPAPDADPVTLVRRLAFDLTGMPPDRALLEAYVAAPSERAYERLVDSLLASPRFGERMAISWLDLVRYADTVGYHGDQDQNVWPYRDYVIHSFNKNKPFDRFTAEQLAGDLLPDADEDTRIASGYNRLLQTSHEGGVQLKEYRAIYLADRVRNVSQVWMAATMGCCQCHDHKFDPLSAEEFYALGAFFADIDDEEHLRTPADGRNNRNPTYRAPEALVRSIYQRERIARLDAALSGANALDNEQDIDLIASIRRIRDEAARPTSMPISAPSEPRVVRVLARGSWQDESGEIVAPRAPAALGWRETAGRASRLDLARWLTNAEDGAGLLTARVVANRYWAQLFGEALARTPDDFGGQGQPPTHPELLDNLAIEFVESGWDTKHFLKLLVMSRSYRQSSVASESLRARDPENRLLARQARYRLPAEMVRDAALTISGLLVERLGGRSVRPYQPAGYYKHLNFPEREYKADDDDNQWRRGVYVHWQRQYLHPTFRSLDAPSREECTARRPRSSTPLAALALLNDPTFVEAARSFAAAVLADVSSDDDRRIDEVFLRAVSRRADPFERRTILDLVTGERGYFAQHPERAEAICRVGIHPSPDGISATELAAWTSACRAVLNLAETTHRN